jgi:hypothetical protein
MVTHPSSLYTHSDYAACSPARCTFTVNIEYLGMYNLNEECNVSSRWTHQYETCADTALPVAKFSVEGSEISFHTTGCCKKPPRVITRGSLLGSCRNPASFKEAFNRSFLLNCHQSARQHRKAASPSTPITWRTALTQLTVPTFWIPTAYARQSTKAGQKVYVESPTTQSSSQKNCK